MRARTAGTAHGSELPSHGPTAAREPRDGRRPAPSAQRSSRTALPTDRLRAPTAARGYLPAELPQPSFILHPFIAEPVVGCVSLPQPSPRRFQHFLRAKGTRWGAPTASPLRAVPTPPHPTPPGAALLACPAAAVLPPYPTPTPTPHPTSTPPCGTHPSPRTAGVTQRAARPPNSPHPAVPHPLPFRNARHKGQRCTPLSWTVTPCRHASD